MQGSGLELGETYVAWTFTTEVPCAARSCSWGAVGQGDGQVGRGREDAANLAVQRTVL